MTLMLAAAVMAAVLIVTVFIFFIGPSVTRSRSDMIGFRVGPRAE